MKCLERLSVLGNVEDKAPDFWPKNAQRGHGIAAGGTEQKESVGYFSEEEKKRSCQNSN